MDAATSKKMDMVALKNLSKKLGVTINDVVMSSASLALREYFKIKKDPLGQAKDAHVNVFIPANIRFEAYKTYKDIKLENKWAALPISLPLIDSMQQSSVVRQATSKIKNSLNFVYGSYALTFWSAILLTRQLPAFFLDQVTRKFTIAISNTPGPLKQYRYKN